MKQISITHSAQYRMSFKTNCQGVSKSCFWACSQSTTTPPPRPNPIAKLATQIQALAEPLNAYNRGHQTDLILDSTGS